MTLKSVLVIGSGKVGRALHSGLRAAGVEASLRHARTLLARPLPPTELVVIASRDGRIEELARLLAAGDRLPRAVVHCAGALDASPLAALAARGVAVGTAHPCLSFPSPRARVTLAGGALLITGDKRAVLLAKELARVLGMNAVCPASLDRTLYHAACALTANGSAALAEASSRLLAAAGVSERDTRRLLGPLLGSVARNVAALSAAEALSGPVARGDVATVHAHQAAVKRATPELAALFAAMVAAQEAFVARRIEPLARGGPDHQGPPGRIDPVFDQDRAGPQKHGKNMEKKGGKSP